jgi:hypothetical protein
MHERAIDLIHRIAVGHDLDLIEPELSREVDAIAVRLRVLPDPWERLLSWARRRRRKRATPSQPWEKATKPP